MSWQSFIDPPTGLLATGHVEMGGIYGQERVMNKLLEGQNRFNTSGLTYCFFNKLK